MANNKTDARGKTTAVNEAPAASKPGEDVMAYDPSLFTPDDTAGYGEGLDRGAFSRPFFTILQALSPICQRGNPAYVEGLQPGMIYNTVTKEATDNIVVSVTRTTHTLASWIPREDGGGFVQEEEAHLDNMNSFAQIVPDDKKRRIIERDKKRIEVIECRNFYVAAYNASGDVEPGIISMAKSQLKTARDWNLMIATKSLKLEVSMRDGAGDMVKAYRPVLFSGVWELGTQMKTKDGNSWFVWTVRFLRLLPTENRALFSAVREQVKLAKLENNVQRQLEQTTEPVDPVEGDI